MPRHIGFGKESAWDTGVPPTIFLEGLSESIAVVQSNIEVKTMRAISTRAVDKSGEHWEGPAEFVGNFQELHNIFYMLLGSVSTTGAGPYTHVIPDAAGAVDDARKSFTIEVLRGVAGQAFTYTGGILTGLTLECQLGQEMRVGTTWIGAGHSGPGAATSSSYSTLDVALPRQIAVKIDAAQQHATNFTLTVDWPHDAPEALGYTTWVAKPQPNDTLTVNYSFEMLYSDETQYDKFVAGDDVDIQVDIQTAGDEAFTLNLNKTRFTSFQLPTDGRQRYRAQIEGMSFYDTDPTENISVTVVNDKAKADFT